MLPFTFLNPFIQQWKYERLLARKHRLQKKQYCELLQILKQRKITTFFQPIIHVNSHTIIGYEALNRPNPSKYFPTTDEFYQFLGETNQIFQFEKFTRQQSIEKYIEMKSNSDSQYNDLIFLNVHPYVLNDSNYQSGQTLNFVEKHQLDPRRIVLEITEKQAVQDYKQFERVLSNYRSQGFKIAIDDVGAGYNSLKTIMYSKPDFIKLDRSFIQNIDRYSDQQKLVSMFMQYATFSNTKVIAEGVERSEELLFLRKIKVDYAQGYFIGKPTQSLSLEKRVNEALAK